MNDRTPTEPTWKTVPTEATTAQLKAGQDAWHNDPLRLSSTLYRAMVAASPPAPAAEVEPVAWGEFYGGRCAAVRLDRSVHCQTPLYTHPLAAAIRAEARRESLEMVGRILSERIAEASKYQAAAFNRKCQDGDKEGHAWWRAHVVLAEVQAFIAALADKGEAE